MHSLALWLLPSPAIHLLGGRCLLALLSLRQRIEQQALPDGLLLNAQKKSNPCLPCFACTPVHDSKAANTLCPRANTPLDRKNSDPFVLLVSCRPRSTLRATGAQLIWSSGSSTWGLILSSGVKTTQQVPDPSNHPSKVLSRVSWSIVWGLGDDHPSKVQDPSNANNPNPWDVFIVLERKCAMHLSTLTTDDILTLWCYRRDLGVMATPTALLLFYFASHHHAWCFLGS